MCSNVLKPVQNLFKCVQICSNMFKYVQTCSNLFKTCSNVIKWVKICSKLFQMSSNVFKWVNQNNWGKIYQPFQCKWLFSFSCLYFFVSGGKWVECFLKTLLASEESVNMIVFSIRCYTRLQNVRGKVMIVFVRVLLRETRNGRHLNTWDTWDTWQLVHRSEIKDKDNDKYCLLLYSCLWSESYEGLDTL